MDAYAMSGQLYILVNINDEDWMHGQIVCMDRLKIKCSSAV